MNTQKIVRESKVVEYEAFDCDVMMLVALAEVVAEYVAEQEVA